MFDFSNPADARSLVCVKSDSHSVSDGLADSDPTPIHDILISYAHEDQGEQSRLRFHRYVSNLFLVSRLQQLSAKDTICC